MSIYLPIAEVSVNMLIILGLGGMVGLLSGMFGVGGGFLMTPLLIFIGIPPPVAVATEANQIVASSISGVLAHWRRGNVDVKMGLVLMVGGFLGSSAGVWAFTVLRGLGQIDLVIRLSFVAFLGTIGAMMLTESLKATLWPRPAAGRRRSARTWRDALPFKMRFRRSRIYVSMLLPLALSFFVGILAAIMGVGGGFIMVPAMIYLLGMPTSIVVGTSLFQIIFVTANVTVLQAVTNQTVDVVLALLLLLGGVVGAQFGARFGGALPAGRLRLLLSLLTLAVCGKLVWELVVMPNDLYSLVPVDARP